MDWIEQLFGISPDGGNGVTEAVILLAIAVVPVITWLIWRRRA